MNLKGVRLGLVGPLPPPSGGMANQTQQLARLLGGEGLDVEVVQVNAPYRPAAVQKWRGVRAVFRLVPYLVRLWRAAGRVQLIHVMANSGWAWHLFAAPAVWIGWLRHVPVIVNYRGGEADAFLTRQLRWVRPTLRRTSKVVVPSGFLEAVFRNRDVAVEIVPNIIDLSRFFPLSRAAAQAHVVVTRNLEDIYDIPTALRAFALIRQQLPDSRMTVAGSGPRLVALQQLCNTMGIASSVRFTGRLDNEAVAQLYRTADLMINPSLADNMPISVLEAMASGVPVVSTNVGGVPYLVRDGTEALLVPPGDAAAIAQASLKLLQDRELASRFVSAGLHAARRYTWSEVKPRLFAVYARALGVEALAPCAP